MIAFLSGTVLFKELDRAVIDVGGVGYQVFAPVADLAKVGGPGASAKLHIHTNVRENAIELFGFLEREGLQLFELLTSISGVGPKLALSALSALPPDDLVAAVVGGDEARLTKIPGVGKKTAARVVLELGDKLRKAGLAGNVAASPTDDGTSDVESALLNLGYKPAQVQKALKAIAPISPGAAIEDLVLQALRHV